MANCELLDWFSRQLRPLAKDWVDFATWEGPDGKKHWYGPHYLAFHFFGCLLRPRELRGRGLRSPADHERN